MVIDVDFRRFSGCKFQARELAYENARRLTRCNEETTKVKGCLHKLHAVVYCLHGSIHITVRTSSRGSLCMAAPAAHVFALAAGVV